MKEYVDLKFNFFSVSSVLSSELCSRVVEKFSRFLNFFRYSSYVDKDVTDLGPVTVSVSVTHGILYKVEENVIYYDL